MNGLNCPAFPIVVEPGYIKGPTVEIPERYILYIHSLVPLDCYYGGRGPASAFCNGEHCPRGEVFLERVFGKALVP